MEETKLDIETGSIVRTVGLDFVDTFLDLFHSIGSLATSLFLVLTLPIRTIATVHQAAKQKKALHALDLSLRAGQMADRSQRTGADSSRAGEQLSPDRRRQLARDLFDSLSEKERRISVNLVASPQQEGAQRTPVYADNRSSLERSNEGEAEPDDSGGDQRQSG